MWGQKSTIVLPDRVCRAPENGVSQAKLLASDAVGQSFAAGIRNGVTPREQMRSTMSQMGRDEVQILAFVIAV